MKCIKCGFESNDSFCPMCGTKLPEAVNTAPEVEQIGVISSEDGPTAYYTSNNPYHQAQQSVPTPQQGMPTPPPYPYPPQGMPTPPPYAPYPPQPPQPKKSGNALHIVLAIIVCTVIVVGTVINVVSSISYKSSILDIFDDVYDSYNEAYDDLYYNDYATDEDDTVHPMNEASDFKYGSVTLTNIEITKDKFEFDDSIRECAFTFEVKNTTDEKVEFYVPSAQVCSAGDDYYMDCYEWLYDDYENASPNYDFTIEAGETKEFVTYYKVPADVNDFSIMFNIYDYDYAYDFYCYFEASIPQDETAVPATEPTTKKVD